MYPKEFVLNTFHQRFGKEPAYLAFAPGRVNLLGEQIDYNDGYVLPAAIDWATYIAFSPAEADHSTLVAADIVEQASFTHEGIQTKTDLQGNLLAEWARYPAGLAWALGEAGLAVPMLEATFASDVPRGAGLSSSASVEMASAMAWSTVGGWTLPPMQHALLDQKAENKYVGINCSLMD